MSQPQLPGKIEGEPRESGGAEGLELSPESCRVGRVSESHHPAHRAHLVGLADSSHPTHQSVDQDVESQFTLRDLFVLVTLCALISLPLSRLPRPIFAGLVGGLTVLLMFLQALFEPRHLLFRCGWWFLLGLYLMACGLAVVGW